MTGFEPRCVCLLRFAPHMSITACHSEYVATDLTDRSTSVSNNGSLPAVTYAHVVPEQETATGVQLLARLRRLVRKKAGRPLSALPARRAIVQGTHPDRAIRDFFENLPSAEKHYWIATYYALLMPQKKRRNGNWLAVLRATSAGRVSDFRNSGSRQAT